ncbi:hypothetical protein C0991_001121, partial [Blastosporella zonata]
YSAKKILRAAGILEEDKEIMPRLLVDPNEAVCPDFTLEDYAEAQEAMLNETTNNEAAIAQLVTLWTATNNVDKRIWARQLQIDLDQTKEAEQGARDLQDREVLQKRQEDQLAIAKERKKNRAKYQDVSEEAPPITAPEIIPSYATTHLQKG